jgi:hypothetical protein
MPVTARADRRRCDLHLAARHEGHEGHGEGPSTSSWAIMRGVSTPSSKGAGRHVPGASRPTVGAPTSTPASR